MGVQTCWQPNLDALRLAVIPNTLELHELWVSPALLDEAKKHPHLEPASEPRPLPFDADGNVKQSALFPRAACGRR
jgi:hypothetical protein